MIYGYARVSTEGQDLAYQLQTLERAGCERIFQEKRSGKNTQDRPELARLLKAVRPGDMVLATVTDRVARDPLDLLGILKQLHALGAGLKLLDEPFIDTTSEMSDLILFIVGWAAKWQRKRILENTHNGRVLAKQRGVKFGRKPALSLNQSAEALNDLRHGRATQAALARRYNVSAATINRLAKTLRGD